MKIKELMKKPIVIEKDVMISEVARIMTEYSISSLIVVNNGEILGIVTNHDLVKHFGETKKVSQVMIKKVVSIRETDKLQKAIEIVREKGIGVFPVVNSKGKIVGIIDSKDLLKVWETEDFLLD